MPESIPPCPCCSSTRVARIAYGLPNFEALQPDLDEGRVVLGGCCIFDSSPKWKCQACAHEWGRALDDDQLHRLRLEAEAAPKSLRQRFWGWFGLAIEDETTLLSGLARRLLWTTLGISIVIILAPFTPPWFGLAILVLWFLPLFWNIALRLMAVSLAVPILALVGFWPLTRQKATYVGKFFGLLVFAMLELGLLIVSFSFVGSWLLLKAIHTNHIF